MQQFLVVGVRKDLPVVFSLMLSIGGCLNACGGAVYPASECKPPPPPLTVPNSPRSQCREVSTEHAKDWPKLYKDVQYLEENAVYRVRLAFSELPDATQKQLRSDFAQAVVEINSADGKYLQLVDAAVGASGTDFTEATQTLSKALEKFVNFFGEHLEGAKTPMPSGAKKDIERAKAALQELNTKIKPPPAPDEENKTDEPTKEAPEDDVVKV